MYDVTVDLICVAFVLVVFSATMVFSLVKHGKKNLSKKINRNDNTNTIQFMSGGAGPVVSGSLVVNGNRLQLVDIVFGKDNQK